MSGLSPMYLTGLGLWSPGYASVSAWREGALDEEVVKPPCKLVGGRLKRGSSRFANMLGEAVAQAAEAGGVDPGAVPIVYGSSLGEIETMVTLLRMLFEEEGKLSPNRFKNSVHNAASGLVSIGTSNTRFTTAIGGGDATFELSLVEAWTLLDDEPGAVLLSVADDVPPAPLDALGAHGALALGFCFASEPRAGALRVENLRRAEGPPDYPIPASMSANATSAGLPLLRAALERTSGTVPLGLPGCAAELGPGFVVDVNPV